MTSFSISFFVSDSFHYNTWGCYHSFSRLEPHSIETALNINTENAVPWFHHKSSKDEADNFDLSELCCLNMFMCCVNLPHSVRTSTSTTCWHVNQHGFNTGSRKTCFMFQKDGTSIWWIFHPLCCRKWIMAKKRWNVSLSLTHSKEKGALCNFPFMSRSQKLKELKL